jgi:hypothetical protein
MQHLSAFYCLLPVICCNFNQRIAKVILKHQTLYMNTRILLLVLSVASLSSCSVYRSGQTPDDVYYSPARVQAQAGNGDDYVDVRQPKAGTNYQSYEQYQDNYRDDRFLRMSIGNPYYLNAYNGYSGFDWRYNSFYDGFNYGFNSPWNNYFAWNNFYNPYALSFGSYYGGSYYGGGYGGGYYGGGGGYYSGGGVKYPINTSPISRPRVFNVNSYSNSNRPAARTYSNGSYYNNNQRYNNGNSGSGNRNYYNNNNSNNNSRSTYTPSSSNSNNSSPARSYTPSSSGSSSSGSSSGSSGGGGVSRPARGN